MNKALRNPASFSVLVKISQDGFVDEINRTIGNNPNTIVGAIAQEFDTDIISEDDTDIISEDDAEFWKDYEEAEGITIDMPDFQRLFDLKAI
jgi:hypothetical protein